ncbi:MAG: anti-sigma F factor [Clostridia bacterium]|nr:anti-sigma F factor [Clostridia bacterium]
MENYIEIKLPAISKNEALARNAIALFCVELNPTVDELDDVKTAVSEAVTNCIVHAYGQEQGEIILRANVCEQALHIEIEDFGVGIEDVESAMKPFFTTKPEDERSGMGFTIMGAFMDNLLVKRNESGGTVVIMDKKF